MANKQHSYEQEIIDFINIENITSKEEFDIYVPDHNLAIEFDELREHSQKNNKYHLGKTELCKEKGIQLFHIFENEWINPKKQIVWKSIISNKLNRNSKIFARKTKVKEITDNKLIREFLDNNHLQGYCPGSIRVGLFYEDELVSIMTFAKSRFSKKYEYEMIRYCSKKFTNITGGASKLYKFFIDNYKPKSVISYADRRYSDGSLYKTLGFEFSHYSHPNYWYFKLPDTTLYSRIKFQKHKLANKLETFDGSKSEVENMIENDYLRIFDCGNVIYTWKDE